MKSKVGRIFMICGVLLILGAAGLLIYNKIDEQRASDQVGQISMKVLNQIVISDEPNDDPDAEPPVFNSKLVLEIDGNEYVGVVSIPSLDLSLAVMSEWSYPKLRVAPCLYSWDEENNSLVLAAHNYSSHFGNLNLLSGGETVIFTDTVGNEFYYTVSEIVITQPTDIEGMLDSQWDLTLFTCTYGGAARVTVRCRMSED